MACDWFWETGPDYKFTLLTENAFGSDPARRIGTACGPVAGLVGIEGGVVSGVINLESSGVEASDWRPRHDEHYHEA
jgi:hypothetical protein